MSLRTLLVLISILLLSSCSGGGKGSISNLFGGNSSPATIPASQVETEKLVNAVNAEPNYKIEDSEIELLKSEGLISDKDQTQLQAIQ